MLRPQIFGYNLELSRIKDYEAHFEYFFTQYFHHISADEFYMKLHQTFMKKARSDITSDNNLYGCLAINFFTCGRYSMGRLDKRRFQYDFYSELRAKTFLGKISLECALFQILESWIGNDDAQSTKYQFLINLIPELDTRGNSNLDAKMLVYYGCRYLEKKCDLTEHRRGYFQYQFEQENKVTSHLHMEL